MDMQEGVTPVSLWFESVQGMANGVRVHVGQKAVFYPDQHRVEIEIWTPEGNEKKTIPIPEKYTEKPAVIRYLDKITDVPFTVIRNCQASGHPELDRDFKTIVTNCMLGLAVGDAMGVPYEFMRRDQAEAAMELEHMSAKGYYHHQPAGAWSDDTAMALASMDSLTRAEGFDPEDMMSAFLDWYLRAAYTSTGETFGVGGTVNRALCSYMNGTPAMSCGRGGIRDNGNGSLMRIAPISLWLAYDKRLRDEEIQLISEASAITHSHEISKLGCLIYTDFLEALIDGADANQAYDDVCGIAYGEYFSPAAIAAYGRILNGKLMELPRHKLRESGYVVDTLEAALWATLKTASYKDAIGEAIRLGYDTDTVAAVTGSLCGVLYGSEGIPQAWKEELLRREYLETLCARFAAAL